jgi:hypothetical protein
VDGFGASAEKKVVFVIDPRHFRRVTLRYNQLICPSGRCPDELLTDEAAVVILPIEATRDSRPVTPAGTAARHTGGAKCELYCALTTLAHHDLMKIRDKMSAVIESLQKEHGLLAAYLEATDKIDWRALQKGVVIGETSKPINAEAHQTCTAPELPEVVPSRSTFVFRRANLARSGDPGRNDKKQVLPMGYGPSAR